VLRDTVRWPEIAEGLHLYELRDPLPRAFWVPGAEVETEAGRRLARLEDPSFDPRRAVLLGQRPPGPPGEPAPGEEGRVDYERVDPHTVRIRARTGPGYLVVLDGYHSDWTAEGPSGPVPVLEADGRYRALATAGGDLQFTLRFRPRWRLPALSVSGAAVVAAVLLCL
jgi:hypothetical protein